MTIVTAVMLAASVAVGHTQNSGINAEKAAAFDARLFAGTVSDKN